MKTAAAVEPAVGRGGPLVFLIAGEPSGDDIGGRLMTALRDRAGESIRFAGVGGEAMRRQGLRSLFPISEISIMGVVEVLPRLPHLFRRIRETADAIRTLAPDIVVSIDSPAFCYRVWKRLRGEGVTLVHYVAPTVWAWRPGRARKFARMIDHLLALLPFEPPYFRREGLACSFVGHPVIESGADRGNGAAFRARNDIDADTPVLGVLPGSRRGEVLRLLGPFGEAVSRLAESRPGLRVVIPVVPPLAGLIESAASNWPGRPLLVRDPVDKYDAMAACDVALAASGTVALELAMARVPMVIGYRINPLTAALVRRMVRVEYVSLVNLLLDRPAVPELLQSECNAARLAMAVGELLDDRSVRERQLAAGEQAIAQLRPDARRPSERAAEIIIGLIGEAAPEAGVPRGAKT